MVGVAGKDRRGTVELFGKHDAAELMRPGHGAEADDKVGGSAQGGIVAVRSADDQRQAAPVFIPEPGESRRELLGSEVLAALVERDQSGAPGELRQQPGRLVMAPGFGEAGAPCGKLDYAAEIQAERGPAPAESLKIALRQIL